MGERSGIENNDIKRDKLWERERSLILSFILSFFSSLSSFSSSSSFSSIIFYFPSLLVLFTCYMFIVSSISIYLLVSHSFSLVKFSYLLTLFFCPLSFSHSLTHFVHLPFFFILSFHLIFSILLTFFLFPISYSLSLFLSIALYLGLLLFIYPYSFSLF